MLLAEIDSAPLAAVALDDGAVTVDPFQHTLDAVRMLFAVRRLLPDAGP